MKRTIASERLKQKGRRAMDNQVTLTIEVPYKAEDGTVKVRKLNLLLSVEDALCEGEESLGQVTINGAVMPVDDPRGGATTPATQEDGLEEQVAA